MTVSNAIGWCAKIQKVRTKQEFTSIILADLKEIGKSKMFVNDLDLMKENSSNLKPKKSSLVAFAQPKGIVKSTHKPKAQSVSKLLEKIQKDNINKPKSN
ncbi:MAG: hypothetical protein JSS07_04080 [Proteobacteria bacterium]|nr:hypothetical protein [Pseudomonadota bacterium]